MRYSILFVIILILLAGFIAYLGDLLGRRMGKRRLTLLHLRPRYTAILFTVVTGMIIAAVAFFALVAANQQFRKVFTEGEAILAQNDSLKKVNKELDARNAMLANKGKTLAIEVEQQSREAKAAREEAAKFLKARNEAQATVKRLEADIAQKKQELEELKSESKVTKAKLQELTKQLEKVKTALSAAKVKLRKAEEQYISASMDLRSGIMIFKQGDEIIRGAVSTNQSPAAISRDIRELLERASERVVTYGAAKGPNNRAVTVIFRQKISDELDYLMRNEDLFITKASETIYKAGSHDQVLVQVVCARNTLKGEQVPVELKLYPNDIVFYRGQRISSCQIDGRQSEGRILMNLTSFLQSAVGWNALQAGIIPISGTFPRASSDESSLGQVEALMEAVDKIKSIDSLVEVTVYAAKDIRAEGPLNMSNMRVEVRKLQ